MVDTVFVFLNDTTTQIHMDLISTAKDFYLDAWDNIKWFILLCIALAGIVFPLWIYFWQRITFRQEIIKQTEKFKDEIQRDLKETKVELDAKISESYFENLSITMGLQSATLIDLKKYDDAITLAIRAVLHSIYAAKIEYTKSLIVDMLIEQILPKISKNKLDETFMEWGKSIEQYISDLHYWDRKVELDSEIQRLEKALKAKLAGEYKKKE